MNERIKELAEQAGYKPLPGFDFANSLEEVFIKKFAELIVRECADIIAEHYDASEPWITPKTLLYHFGVEK
jgi:hypothetical protein